MNLLTHLPQILWSSDHIMDKHLKMCLSLSAKFFVNDKNDVGKKPDCIRGVTENDADELIEFVKQLKDEVETWLEKEHPELA